MSPRRPHLVLTCALLVAVACPSEDERAGAEPCVVLFGAPSADTGLSVDQCASSCDCDDLVFAPPAYSQEDVAALGTWELNDPPTLLDVDPYEDPDAHQPQPDRFCAVHPEEDARYRLETHDDLESVEQAGAVLTHHGACGLCSSLRDLGVYMASTDLSGPVRQCALLSLGGSFEDVVACLEELGFSTPCAQIWAYNSLNTRQECLDVCIEALDEPYHLWDGSLNPCIQCDEDLSGQVFKAVAGRTRRNSGLPTALCRPCGSVAPVVHAYP